MTEYIPLEVTPEQRSNLEKLKNYLLGPLQADFDMGTYDGMDDCGSVGCAVGHGPYAGIKKTENSWGRYADRVFGASDRVPATCNGRLYDYCFNSSWSSVDNTAVGAAERIETVLTRGIPTRDIRDPEVEEEDQ